MSAHTKTRRIRISKKNSPSLRKTEKSISWREVAKKNIKKYGEIGTILRGSRQKEDLTQKELADALEVLPHHVSEMEHGKRPISKKMAHKLGKVLNMNYKTFL